MPDLNSIVLYVSLFISLFFEVFLLITYLEVRMQIKVENKLTAQGLKRYPSTTVIIPCWNEEKTVAATVKSVLNLDYPKDKLKVILVDDGSTDNTLREMNKFKDHSQVTVVTKENGGKHVAVNLGIEMSDTELVTCLDADSFVDPQALKNMVFYFEDPTTMAVTPSIKVFEAKTFIQKMQKNEYRWGVFLRRLLSSMGALYVTPGPFSIFRKNVFVELGAYRHAHLCEDMEMALRMQKNRYKIVNAHSAHVNTVTPNKLGKLITQKTRWTYGFINNAFDYRELFFNRKYGHIGVFILPIATFSIFYTPFMVSNLVVRAGTRVVEFVERLRTVGFSWDLSFPSFDWYFLNTGITTMLTMSAFGLTLVILYLAVKLAEGKFKFDRTIVYYLAFYSFFVPLWLTKAIYKTIFRGRVSWR